MMDSGRGYFIPVEITPEEKERIDKAVNDEEIHITKLNKLQGSSPNHGGTFYRGQNLKINGSKFRVLEMNKKTLLLKLLPKDK